MSQKLSGFSDRPGVVRPAASHCTVGGRELSLAALASYLPHANGSLPAILKNKPPYVLRRTEV